MCVRIFVIPGCSTSTSRVMCTLACWKQSVCSECWMLIGFEMTTLDRMAMLTDTGSDRGGSEYTQETK